MADKTSSGSRHFTVLSNDGPKLSLKADKLGYDGNAGVIVLKLTDDTIVGVFPMENTRAVYDVAAAKGKK
jgi:hypothetical protein